MATERTEEFIELMREEPVTVARWTYWKNKHEQGLSPMGRAMKTLYLVTRSLDPKGTGQTRWVTRWKPALNAFAITFADRMPAAEDH